VTSFCRFDLPSMPGNINKIGWLAPSFAPYRDRTSFRLIMEMIWRIKFQRITASYMGEASCGVQER
jgi:hypothetical protein